VNREITVTLVEAFGFQLMRVRGSHHIFGRPEVPEQAVREVQIAKAA